MSNLGEKFSAYKPSKTVWFWSSAACVVLTVIVGFTFGGWVTGGAAADRAERAAETATADLAASICAFRFLAAPDAAASLAALQAESSYKRDGLLEEAGWVTFAGAEKPVDGAAELCADRLAEAEVPTPVAEAPASAVAPAATVVH